MLVNGERLSNNVTVLQCNSLKRNNNVTVLNNVRRHSGFEVKQKSTEYLASKLVEKFSAPEWKRFFLKAAWRLSEDAIWSTYEMALSPRVKDPLRYFIAACNKQM